MDLPPSLMAHVAQSNCLNEDSEDNLALILRNSGSKNLLRGGRRALLRSDCDEQLLLQFQFPPNEAARVSHIYFVAPAQGAAIPKSIRVFVTERSISFGTIDSLKPLDVVTLDWKPIPSDPGMLAAVATLNTARLHSAYQFSIFVPDNTSGGDDDVTVLSDIKLLGEMAKSLGTTSLPQRG